MPPEDHWLELVIVAPQEEPLYIVLVLIRPRLKLKNTFALIRICAVGWTVPVSVDYAA